MAGKWPPPPDYDVDSKFSVTETTYGAMNHSVTMLLERRRAQNKCLRDPTIRQIPPPPPTNLCMTENPEPGLRERISPPPIHTSIDCPGRNDRYLHDMEQYERYKMHYPTETNRPKASNNRVRIGRWGSNWSNLTSGRNAVGGFDIFINGNARLKAQFEENRREAQECFERRRMPLYATNRTSRLAIERNNRDPFDTYCTMLTPPNQAFHLDFRNVDCSYPLPPPPDYKYKGFYQYRPFRGSVGIAAYNNAMKGYFELSRHQSRVPQPVTTV